MCGRAAPPVSGAYLGSRTDRPGRGGDAYRRTGAGTYLTDAAHGESGATINLVGIVQLFIGPPYQTQAVVARDGTLGQVRFSGTSVDGKRGEGVVRWECSETKPL